ncbi:retrovirus-related pol polyprotein from transposon TNT 1-94 [Tanacetum coccineum]
MNFLSALLTARIIEQVKNQLLQILLEEVSNFAPPVIQKMVLESLKDVVLAKESSQPQSSYKATATLIEFELKNILIDKMDKSKSYLAAPEHRKCYEGLIRSYDLDKTIFSTYEEPEFEVADSDMPQDQEENLGNDDVEPKEKVASKHDWFTKPIQPQEPIDPDYNVNKTPQQGQNQSWLMTLASFADKLSKTFDELMSTLIDYSAFIMNSLKINNLTQEKLLGPTFRLLKGTRSNYAELEYDFEECYKALSEKLNWENPEGGDYLLDLTKPLPLVMIKNRRKVPVDYFFNNDLKYLQGGILTMTYTTSLIKTKAAQYILPSIKDMVPNIWVPVKVEVMRKHGYGYLKEIFVRRADNDLYRFKEGDFPRLHINDIEDMLLLVVQNRLTNLSGDDVSDFAIAIDKQLKERRLLRSLEKFVGGRHYGTDLRHHKIALLSFDYLLAYVIRANNDLNVFYGSPLFGDVLVDTAPEAPFVLNGRTYKKRYYLADVQESARKDIERALEFYKVVRGIIRQSAQFCYLNPFYNLENCIITEYLVDNEQKACISSLNEDILKITIRKDITPLYLARLIVRIKRLLGVLEVTAAKISLLEEMDQDSVHMVVASKVPMLKPENVNAPPVTKLVEGVETTIAPTTAKEKEQMSLEVLDQTFNRIQKRVNQLEIPGESISQEDVNQKFLRSLSLEWNTHTIVWRNKPDIDTLSLDDLYNNLKIYEPEVKGTSSSNTNTQNVAFVSLNSTNSTNGAVNTAQGATTASTQATTVNSTTIDNLSDAVIFAFFAS